jgi:inward rectifier potassium channel
MDARSPSARGGAPPPYPRLLTRTGRPRVLRKGLRLRLDLYHSLLTAPIWALLVGATGFFVAENALFAGLFLVEPQALSDPRAGYLDALFMSMQLTSGTGLSALHPVSLYGRALASAATFVGLINLALMTGLVFNRISRPTARIMFSERAVIADFDGRPHLMFRAANERADQILEAEVDVTLARQADTAEGVVVRRFHALPVVRNRSPLFALTWTVMHPIDEASPLFGATRESLLGVQAEIIVLMSGVDETLAERVHARHSYLPTEIVWGGRFADVLSTTADGRRAIDYQRFHDVEERDS